MNTFDKFPQDRRCPICGTADERPGVLVTDSDKALLDDLRHGGDPLLAREHLARDSDLQRHSRLP